MAMINNLYDTVIDGYFIQPFFRLRDLSNEHLNQADATYFQHMLWSFGYGVESLKASAVFFVHGIAPGFFQTKGSDSLKKTLEKIEERKKAKKVVKLE